jgi:hypothetical protein
MIWQTTMHAYQNLEYNIIVTITMITLTTKVKHSQEKLKKQTRYKIANYTTIVLWWEEINNLKLELQ